MEWIAFTCLAALMQSVRTAAQKHMSRSISPMAVTAVRYVYGLPFIVLYFLILSTINDSVSYAVNQRFIAFALLASIAQVIATLLLIQLFQLRNFAIGTSFAKTEALITAVLGTLLFVESLSHVGWFSVIMGVFGILLISQKPSLQTNKASTIKSAILGLASGSLFAITSLSLRQASLSLDGVYLFNASYTLLFMVVVQTVMSLMILLIRDRQQITGLFKQTRSGLFVGLTSALGSIGWFTAMTLQNVAYVKALGQIEFFFTLIISRHFFIEHISMRELLGMGMILVSVVLIMLFA